MDYKKFKKKLIDECKTILQERINTLDQELKHIAHDIAEDTKSSAGDKFETSRELANAERQKILGQLETNRRLSSVLENIGDGGKDEIHPGNLIKTNRAWVFLSISLGQLKIDKETILVVSPASPLGHEFAAKKVGETAKFNSMNYKIQSIY